MCLEHRFVDHNYLFGTPVLPHPAAQNAGIIPQVPGYFGSPVLLVCDQCVHWRHYRTREEACREIVEYIMAFYISWRTHSYLDYQSPNDFGRNGMLVVAD